MHQGYIIETNMCIVANQKNPQADIKCVLSTINLLKEAREKIIYIDDKNKIMAEYATYLSFSGQPGLGDEFFRYLHENQAVAERCKSISITSKDDDPDDYEEFPRHPNLKTFDPSDRKWVAVALASGDDPTIFNAVDSDWVNVPASTWEEIGVRVVTICPQCISSKKAPKRRTTK